MKSLIILFILCGSTLLLKATDPIKNRTFFIEVDLTYSFYHYYNQVLFEKKGHSLGGAIAVGHRLSPVFLEYNYQSPLIFSYRNNQIRDHFQEIGLRYNLNHLTYIIPHGIDPYVGAGLMMRTNAFTQYQLTEIPNSEILSQNSSKSNTYKLCAGVKLGNKNVRLGLHYDYLPRGLDIPNPEGTNLQIYNAMHIFSARVGIRLNKVPSNRIKCPRFNKRVKRALKF